MTGIIPRQLYRQIVRNCRALGWEGHRGVPLSLMDTGDRPLSEMSQVKYYWDVDWGEGYSQGWVFNDQSRPELHSLLYEVKNGMNIKDLILEAGGITQNVFSYRVEVARLDKYNDTDFMDLLFRVVKETGEWVIAKRELHQMIGDSIEYRADMSEINSRLIFRVPFE